MAALLHQAPLPLQDVRVLAQRAADFEALAFNHALHVGNVPSDARIIAGAHRGLSAILFGAHRTGHDPAELGAVVAQLRSVHERAPGLPIIVLGEQGTMIEEASPVVVEALREQQAQIEGQRATIQSLRSEVEALKAALAERNHDLERRLAALEQARQ